VEKALVMIELEVRRADWSIKGMWSWCCDQVKLNVAG
jgi:hypothetical protein